MDPALAALATMLKNTQHRRVIENTPSVSARATPPQLPAFQIPGMNAQPVGTPPFLPTIARAPAGSINEPAFPAAPVPAPPMPPGNEPLPSTMTQSATAADAGNPIAKSESVWDTFRRMMAQGQVPQQYRGAMGELIGNT